MSKPVLIHGFIIVLTLAIIQVILDALQKPFLLFMPPLGFAFFMVAQYLIQPIMVGALNIALLHRLYGYEGWQTGFWLNGIFLLLAFSTITVIFQTIFGLAATPYIMIAEVFLMPLPFGYLGKFSNRGNKPATHTQQQA
ncbi:hypothetical protein G4O51_02385 [Candidatus Bathyarchaeota archaeon A05DMB-2]|nr:hypothetical protein [Candidatus Bathyarchaeota archaeon A05DMB-2]